MLTSDMSRVQQAFTDQMSLKTWNGYLKDNAVKLGETTLREPELLFQQAHLKALIRSGDLMPLLVERDDRLQVLPVAEEWQAGDRLIYLLHDPRPQLLKQLAGNNNKPLVIEKLPEVEEIPFSVSL